MRAKELEEIYNNVVKEFNNISHFYRLTAFTYDLALASVEKNADYETGYEHPEPLPDELFSYSAADRRFTDLQLVRGWVSFEEYSKESDCPLEEVQEKASKGELGEIRYKNGKARVFWPPEEQGMEGLPPVDSKKKYKATVSIKGTAFVEREADLEQMISSLGSFDKLEKQASKAILLLNRETFLLYWTTFEQYIKNMTFALFDLFPEQVFKNKKYGKNQMTYYDIFEGSSKFTNIEDLKGTIISSILGDPSTERESISKQISFIQDCYIGKNENPYDTWYVYKGERKGINYQVLDQLRIIRNSLVHKNGEMTEDWDKIDLIDEPEDNRIVVDNDLLLKIEMILKSISYNLYYLISHS